MMVVVMMCDVYNILGSESGGAVQARRRRVLDDAREAPHYISPFGRAKLFIELHKVRYVPQICRDPLR